MTSHANHQQTATSSTALHLLTDLITNYTPTWHFSMGKVGFECNFCLRLIANRTDFNNALLHTHDCAYIAALTWRRQQSQPPAQPPG